jgi:hypothetical protein
VTHDSVRYLPFVKKLLKRCFKGKEPLFALLEMTLHVQISFASRVTERRRYAA